MRLLNRVFIGGGAALGIFALAAVSGALVLPPGTDSDCAGQTPIVVASDEAAQSDLYSAATLAGVLDTSCVVLAGARDEPMPADQLVRLEAADAEGWIVGGTAAVPVEKVAGRRLKRLDGVDRWHTARLAGAVAADPDGDVAALTTATAPVAGAARGTSVMVDGAEVRLPPGIDSDCAGQVPIVVAVDADAQADLYSAATLAGVLDTTCIVLAGARGEAMTLEQRGRLFAAKGDGWIVGGETAVPPEKTAGYNLARQGGTDRWHTARLIGTTAVRQSATDTEAATSSRVARRTSSGGGGTSRAPNRVVRRAPSVGGSQGGSAGSRVSSGGGGGGTRAPSRTPTRTPTPTTVPPLGPFAGVSASGSQQCALRAGGAVLCTLSHDLGQETWAPQGSFSQVSAGYWHGCGLRQDWSVDCWGSNSSGQAFAPSGWFRSVSAGWLHSCAVREASRFITCWGYNEAGQLDAPAGSFWSISASGNYTCGVRLSDEIACWGVNAWGQLDAPRGSYTAVSAGGTHACGLRTDGEVTCWGNNLSGQSSAPGGTFLSVSAGGSHSCGVRPNQSVTCWGSNSFGQLNAPPGVFNSVAVGEWHSCALRADSRVVCWGAETSWRYIT